MRIVSFIRSVSGLLAACICLAQPPDGTFQITGTVLNSQTGAPVKGALATLLGIPIRAIPRRGEAIIPSQYQPIQPAPVLTDANGSYRFAGLPATKYRVSVEKPGYTWNPPQESTRIDLGPSRDDYNLHLTPLAKIRGRVTSRDGDPVPGVSIRALRTEIQDGRRTAREVRSVNTDDLGRYRLWNLEPGAYYIVAAGRGGNTQLVVGQADAGVNSHEGFAAVFFGGAADRTSAELIALSAGQELEANLEVVLQPVVRVRGRLRNVLPYQQVKVELWRDGTDVTANRSIVNATNGEFEPQDVVAGSYWFNCSLHPSCAVVAMCITQAIGKPTI